MGQPTIDAVLAGTKSFAVALLAPLTARIGNRPRVAADPSQVLGLCSGPSALAVVEFTGEGSLGTIQALVRDGRGLRVVAGVPTAHAGADGTLMALGVEVGRWDGKIDGVVLAVERAVTAMSGAASAPTQLPAAPGPRPAPGAAPAAPKAAAPTAAVPRPAVPGVAPVVPASKPAAPAAQRPPAAAAKAATVPPPARPAVPKPGAASAPAPRPAAAPARASPPAAEPPPPTLSRPPAPGAGNPAPAAPARPPASFFDDLEGDDVNIDEEPPAAAPVVDMHAPGVYVPPPAAAKVAWPGGICGDAEAGEALRRALEGKADVRPLHALAAKVIEAASELERAVLKGGPQPFDATPVRKATVIRLRVAEALASAPAPGSPVDTAALSATLGQIDALLAEVAPLLQSAPEELVPALEAVRNSLVSEAIDFSEAAQRVAAPTQAAPASAIAAPRRPQQARVLAMAPESEADRAQRRRGIVFGVLLVLILASAGAYHGYHYWKKSQLAPPPPPIDLPAGYQLPNTGTKGPIVLYPKGKPDRAALQGFREAQGALGRDVYEMQNGTVLVVPKGTPTPPGVKP